MQFQTMPTRGRQMQKQPLISRAKVPQAIGQYSKGKATTNMPGISVAAKMLPVPCLTLFGHGSKDRPLLSHCSSRLG